MKRNNIKKTENKASLHVRRAVNQNQKDGIERGRRMRAKKSKGRRKETLGV